MILDLWDRKVIGWSMSKELTAESVSRALVMAVGNRPPEEGLIFHSDRGAILQRGIPKYALPAMSYGRSEHEPKR